jgi:hypothetical protein
MESLLDFLYIIGRGCGKLLGLRSYERPESFEAGQSVVAAVMAVGLAVLTLVAVVYWLLS